MLMSNATRGVIGLKKGTQAEVCHWCSWAHLGKKPGNFGGSKSGISDW